MSKSKQSSLLFIVAGFFGGLVLALFFAKKKGSVLRAQLHKVKQDAGTVGQVVLLKDEYVALFEEVAQTLGEVWHSKEMQAAVTNFVELTKEVLPRIESDSEIL